MTERSESAAVAGFVRPARTPSPEFPRDDITVAAPPTVPDPQRGAVAARVLPVVLALSVLPLMAATMVAAHRSEAGIVRNSLFMVGPLVMTLSMLAAALTGRGRRAGGDVDGDREHYLTHLAELGTAVVEAAVAQQKSLSWSHPAPDALATLAGGPRMWERRPSDADFGQVRVGIGPMRPARRLVPPASGGAEHRDPVSTDALRRLLAAHSTIAVAPVAIALLDHTTVEIDGDDEHVRGLLRAVICQCAMWHGPDLMLIAAIVAESHRHHWDWLKWLPHHQHPSAVDGLGPVRMTYTTPAGAQAGLARIAGHRHLVVLLDGGTDPGIAGGTAAGVTVIAVGAGRVAAGLRLRVSATAVLRCSLGDDELLGRPDRLDPVDALACARRLSGYRIPGIGADDTGGSHWPGLIGIEDPAHHDPNMLWHSVNAPDRLRVPIGIATSGEPVYLDIKEAAADGMGPHGLCIGATGSGKSELLRTIVLGMMARHAPDVLNLVLIDFKGGATFAGMERTGHVAALITNLAAEAPLVARMRDALSGEMNRRQELLRSAGDFVSAAAYRDAQRSGAPLTALPTLFVIVDEFTELLSQQPDFIEVFVAIGRLGRSLGIHLLLASQRLEEGRLRGLESHLSYRLCLKTLSAGESRAVLGVPDAYQLPTAPGGGYLCSPTGELTRFRAAFVSGPYGNTWSPAEGADVTAVRRFTAAPSGAVKSAEVSAQRETAGCTVLQVVLDRLSGHGPPARKIWLPPLDAPPALAGLLEAAAGRDSATGDLVVPIGIVDRPFEQRRDSLLVDLAGARGHVAVVGGPRSGKSTALITLVTALAATHDPTRVQVYCVDFGGGALGVLQSLPQVGSVAGRAQPDLIRRTVATVESILARREALFGVHGIDSMQRYRQLRADRQPSGAADRFGDVFLVIDGWAVLCREFDALETAVVALAGRGLSFGVHVVLSASRWADVRPALRDQIGTRIELRLGDPADSEMDRKQARQVPLDRPGRGLADGGLHMLLARPDPVGVPLLDGPAAPRVLLLPTLVHRHRLTAAADLDRALLLGVAETELAPVTIDFGRQPHLVILGDNECGKTAALRLLCGELMRTCTGKQAQLLIVDYRRTLLDVVGAEHLGGYAASAGALSVLLPELLAQLSRRMPGPEVDRQQLRDRSWWSGPHWYLIVDDYDLVAAAAGNPLTALLDLLPHAGDLGLHLVVARRSGGAARALYEPVLAALREQGCMGLTMSGNPEEGPLLGVGRAVRLPPGRGTLITRSGGEQLVQLAWSPPP